jgi:hypothetical protein
MIRNTAFVCGLVATLVAVRTAPSHAQCDSCAAPTVAYQPVAAAPVAVQPTVTYTPYTGWYPGKWFDQMRLRRWERSLTPVATYPAYAAPYSAGYATYTASYVPYTAGYGYSAGYAPYVSGYAPLQRPVVSTAYMPVSSYSYMPTTAYRPVMLRPVVALQPAVAACSDGCSACSACSTCAAEAPCSTCGSAIYDESVGQASYAAPTGGCSSCAAAAAGTDYGLAPISSSPATSSDPLTPQPSLKVEAPEQRFYGGDHDESAVPGPAADDAVDSSTQFDAPQLLSPYGDKTASRRPTVDVWTAVYHGPAATQKVSAPARSASTASAKTQAERDAEGWSAVAR